MSVAIPSLRGAIAVPEWAKNELWRKARVVPSLDLRFADLKSLVDAATGASLVTFSRASGGGYVGSDGLLKTAAVNEPRFTHDPVTGESLGLLIEEQRVNLLQKTEEFDDAAWISGGAGTVEANTEIAPNGSNSGDRLTTEGVIGSRYQNVAVTAATQYTFSVYVKLGTMTAGAYKVAFYDNTANTFISQDVVPAQLPSNSRWTRVSFTVTTPAGCTSMRVYPFRNGSPIPSSTVFFWGAQLEAGTFPTSYIRNFDTALGVTRQPDLCQISGSNFSSWYNASEGTIFSSWRSASAQERISWALSDGTFNESMYSSTIAPTDNNRSRFAVIDGGVSQAGLSLGVYSVSMQRNSAFAYKLNDFAGTTDGATVSTDNSGTIPSVDRLSIGANWLGSGLQIGGTIKRLTFWPQRLSNEILRVITQ